LTSSILIQSKSSTKRENGGGGRGIGLLFIDGGAIPTQGTT